jgi:5-methyltetrahydrofolate--homocysteine methyltransferase
MKKVRDLLKEPGVILADGAMGTMLFEAGLDRGESPERWNLDHAERVGAVHRSYIEAGARIILTNTFGGNRLRLALHGLDAQVGELNRRGAETAREAVQETGGRAWVAGDIGPSGGILAPLGEVAYADAVDAFAEQAGALLEGGVDLLWIETMSDLEEVRAAVEGVRRVSKEVDIITTMTFDTRGHTMMGVSPQKAVDTLTALGAAALGGNCGNGPDEILGVLHKMHTAAPGAVLVAKANAGIPRLVAGQPHYDAGPAEMAEYAVAAAEAGARIIGACCGSTPAHLAAMRKALAEKKLLPVG